MRGTRCKYTYDPASASAPRSRFGRWVDWMMSFPVVLFGIMCILGILSVLFMSAMNKNRSYAESENIAGRIRSFEREGHRFLYIDGISKFGMLHDPDCPCSIRRKLP